MKKPVHIVPMWSEELGRNVETVWPSITEHRITAARTEIYAGNDAVEFGAEVTERFRAQKKTRKGKQISAEATVTFPEWARMTVYKIVAGQRVAFVGPVCRFDEYFGERGGLHVPNLRWCRAPTQMLEKCAEAAALRRAFPEELGSQPVAEEMEDRRIEAGGVPIGPGPSEPKADEFKADRGTPKDGIVYVDTGDDDGDDIEGVEVVEDRASAEAAQAAKPQGSPPAAEAPPQAPVPARDETPPQPAAVAEEQAPPPPPTDPEEMTPEEARIADAVDNGRLWIQGKIEELREYCSTADQVRDFTRTVKAQISSFAIDEAEKNRLRGRLAAAALEHEKKLAPAGGRR